jgi:hypothetical protein
MHNSVIGKAKRIFSPHCRHILARDRHIQLARKRSDCTISTAPSSPLGISSAPLPGRGS